MCLAVPGRITELYDAAGMAMGRVDFGGITREACMAYVPDARPGDYVLIHAGFAISQVDEDEARQTLADLKRLGELAAAEQNPE
jgi:hydrogenase expression/formation protein HypC